jgi:hypothetical protein
LRTEVQNLGSLLEVGQLLELVVAFNLAARSKVNRLQGILAVTYIRAKDANALFRRVLVMYFI